MNPWHICGRCFAAPPPADWRAQLATRLGQRPRRIGEWAELALFGALQCLADAGETTLPAGARLSVASLHGPDKALRAALAEARDDLPLPIGFLQSQPNQVLPILAHHMHWQGDGRCLTTRDPLDALRLALCETDHRQGVTNRSDEGNAAHPGVLLGWLDETGDSASCWLRLRPAAMSAQTLLPGDFARLGDRQINHLCLDGPGRLLVA